MDINVIWAAVEPFVSAVAGTAAGGVIVGFICKLLQKKLLRKLDANDVANRVAEKLGKGMTVDVDLTAVTEKRLDKVEQKLHKQEEKMREETASYRCILTQIGKAVAHLKSLTDDEKQALQGAITTLDSDYIPPAPEKRITVKLEPIATDEPSVAEEENMPDGESLINFGGLEK